MLGLKSFCSAAITLAGIELAHRIRKGQYALQRRHDEGSSSLKELWDVALNRERRHSFAATLLRQCTRSQKGVNPPRSNQRKLCSILSAIHGRFPLGAVYTCSLCRRAVGIGTIATDMAASERHFPLVRTLTSRFLAPRHGIRLPDNCSRWVWIRRSREESCGAPVDLL